MDFGQDNRDLFLDPRVFTEPVVKPARNNSFVSLVEHSDLGSVPSSPAQSWPDSTETEESIEGGEDDEYVAELTRQMADYMLQDDDGSEKPWGYGGSPKTTLWWAFGSDRDSAVGSSRESSPPSKHVIDIFETMKLGEEIKKVNNSLIPLGLTTHNPVFQSRQALIHDQIKAAQLKQLRRVEAASQTEGGQQDKFSKINEENKQCSVMQGNQSNHSQKSQQSGAGSRAGSVGTGVFFPRRTDAPLEARKKTGGATVLIPARVVQALKLHFDKTGVPSRLAASLPSHHDVMTAEGDILLSPENGRFRAVSARKSLGEIGLPQEWTY